MKFSESCLFEDKYREETAKTLKVENWFNGKVMLTFNDDPSTSIRIDSEALIMAIKHCMESGDLE